ncbi:MAG: energy-coupling factor ABC transporter ATP-binding protein [Candidatus Saccharibacteria bacterium]
MESEWIIETRDICYEYHHQTKALQNVSLKIARGQKTVILGSNGAGKSTLFLHFNGVLRPGQGEVFFEGAALSYGHKALAKIREQVSVVLQNPDDQIFSNTVEEDIAFGPMNLGLPRKEVDSRVEEALSLTGMAELRERSSQQLSYGQRKRVALAGALAMRPQVLIMDEPTAGLDTQMVGELMELTDKLSEQGMTVILSTHDVDLAYNWADSVHVLNKGRLVFSGTPEGFFSRPRIVYETGLVLPMLYEQNRLIMAALERPDHPHPKASSELLAKTRDGPLGRLWVHVCNGTGGLASGPSPSTTAGIYGPASRCIADKVPLNLEYPYNGLEGCLGEVLLGRDAVLILDPGLTGRVKKKLERLDKVFGRKIEAIWM